MKKLLTLIALAVATFVGYALFWPSEFAPQAWNTPTAPLEAPPADEATLTQAQRLADGMAAGPEDVAVDRQGRLYAGYEDGTIRRFDENGQNGEVFATTNGRPLGLAFTSGPVAPPEDEVSEDEAGDDETALTEDTVDPDAETLIVADAVKGLLAISPGGDIEMLANGAEGTPFGFTDDVDVADNGTIYFTDASSKYAHPRYRADILEHGGHGRLLKYDPANGRTTVLLGGLQFANGVAVGPDDAFVLVTETGNYRVLRYWLTGDKAGQTEAFARNLPGFPDGISYSDTSDTFWIALFAPRNALVDFMADKPWLRRIIFRLPEILQPAPVHMGQVLGVSAEGRIHTYLRDARRQAFAPITSVEQADDMLYLGSLQADAFARLPRPDMPPEP